MEATVRDYSRGERLGHVVIEGRGVAKFCVPSGQSKPAVDAKIIITKLDEGEDGTYVDAWKLPEHPR